MISHQKIKPVQIKDMINSLTQKISTEPFLALYSTNSDSDSDGIPDGWEYCYALYGMDDPTTLTTGHLIH